MLKVMPYYATPLLRSLRYLSKQQATEKAALRLLFLFFLIVCYSFYLAAKRLTII